MARWSSALQLNKCGREIEHESGLRSFLCGPQSSYEDFTRGTARGVSIRNGGGGLELAPAFKVVYTSPSTYIWSIAADKDGVIYAATGAPARVYRITPDGKSMVVFEPKELQVQSIALGPDG